MAKASEAELRAKLIATARNMVARDGAQKFSLKQLYAQSGVGRAGFQRCFSDKADLLAAMVGNDAQALGAIAEVMAPVQDQVHEQAQHLKIAVGAGRIVAAPPVDAWLERRLRVFERALASLESRQENAERALTRSLSLLEEKIIAPGHAMAASDEPAPGAAEETQAAEIPAALMLPQEDPAEEPVTPHEIDNFIAHARAAAQRAAQSPPPVSSPALPRWIAWMGVALVTLLVCAGLALGNVARATQMPPQNGIAYRTVPQDALGRLVALADSGDARAQTLLALAYLRGQYGPNDDSAALRWSQAAAQQGQPVAQYLLGALLSKQDAPHAFSWFQEAALHGNLKAMHNLAIAYAQGEGVEQDDRRAAAWFGRAAGQGYEDSQFDLAVLFERGQGVAQNRIAALKWYLIAAAHGDTQAQARAEQLRAQMPPADAAKAVNAAARYVPQPHDQLANNVASP